jgi:hypothetical protein
MLVSIVANVLEPLFWGGASGLPTFAGLDGVASDPSPPLSAGAVEPAHPADRVILLEALVGHVGAVLDGEMLVSGRREELARLVRRRASEHQPSDVGHRHAIVPAEQMA